MPDLFLTKAVYDELGSNVVSVIYEIYHQTMVYNEADQKYNQLYCLVQTDTFPHTQKIPLIEFADMDRDGMTDMVFYDETQSAIYTLYNRKVANKASDDSLCSKPSEVKNLVGDSNRIFTSFASIE